MLQQTQVATVIGYYQRFLERFPTVAALAAADADAVLAAWSGLGYYSRARNLHAAARRLAADGWPADAAGLASLPGIGESTAAAIATFCFGQREAILDGNVRRVYARYLGIEADGGDPRSRESTERLWAFARAVMADPLLSDADAPALIQGLMDLGSGICTRSRPACTRCPLSTGCAQPRNAAAVTAAVAGGAAAAGAGAGAGSAARSPADDRRPLAAEVMPPWPPTPATARKRARRPLPWREYRLLLVIEATATGRTAWLRRRPSGGLWGGLWSLPELGAPLPLGDSGSPIDLLPPTAETPPRRAAIDQELASLGVSENVSRAKAGEAATAARAGFDHVFTHFRMRARIHRVDLPIAVRAETPLASEPAAAGAWVGLPVDAAAISAAPLSTPIRQLLLAEAEGRLEPTLSG